MPSSFVEHCLACPYRNGNQLPEDIQRIRSVPLSLESHGSKVLLVFQAPGIEEWKSGRPISSVKPQSAGGKLEAAFKILGKTRQNYDITNVVQCFPGKKKPKWNKAPRDNPPPKTVRTCCSKWLKEDIAKNGYERVVVFGRHAEKAIIELGDVDSRFDFVSHPTASGVSIATLAKNVSGKKPT